MNEAVNEPSGDSPSVSRLAGQLEYLFEEHPELRGAPVAQLVARLNEEDRWARAITRYPNRSDAEVHGHLAEFHDRIGAVEVEQARQQVARPGPTSRNSGAARPRVAALSDNEALAPLIAEGKLQVVGREYLLATGRAAPVV